MEETNDSEMSRVDAIMAYLEMGDILKNQGIKATEENLDKHFPYRDVGVRGMVCPECGSKRLWIEERDHRDICLKGEHDAFRCIDCDEISFFHHDNYSGCYEEYGEWSDRRQEEAYAEAREAGL